MSPVFTEPSSNVFVTGATGFIGHELFRQIRGAGFESVTCLVRRADQLRQETTGAPDVRTVVGDLNDPTTYAAALTGVDTVVHLAAATGSASESELNRVNIRGTADLLSTCRLRNVRKFVYLSSIAATYPELRDYPYGRTKREAESLVEAAGLAHTILRPTIVLGERSPNWAMLCKLACLPVVPLFGGGEARIQPVDVNDVARGIVAILKGSGFAGATIELGGPDVLTFADFLALVRRVCGRTGFPGLSIPVVPVRWFLKAMGKIAGSRMPVSAGQLSPFICDGTAKSNAVFEQLRPTMSPLESLLQRIAPTGAVAGMERNALEREARVFTRYLTGREPDPYVLQKYVEGNVAVLRTIEPIAAVDTVLLKFASASPMRTRIADAYARIFRPRGMLRRKLMMILAILENSRGFHRDFTAGSNATLLPALMRMALAVGTFCFLLGIGVVLLGPRHLLSRSGGSGR